MAKIITKSREKDSNILWLTNNVSDVDNFQQIYARFYELQSNPKVPWILLNICCDGSDDANVSSAILSLLLSSQKPIKTQIISSAMSFGCVFACVGEERVAWPNAHFMHHSFHLTVDHTSLEDLERDVKFWRKADNVILDFMKKKMGAEGYAKFISDFKKTSGKDMQFTAQAALNYNIVDRIGMIEPLYI